MLENKTQELLSLSLSVLSELEKNSREMFGKISPLIQELSHSFGIKTLSDIHYDMIAKIDKRVIKEENFDLLGYYKFELYPSMEVNGKEYKLTDNETFLSFIKNETNIFERNETKDLLIILMETLEELYKAEKEVENVLLDLLKEPSYAFGVKNIDAVISFIENGLDKDIYKGYYALFEWFGFENEFGKKELVIEQIELNKEREKFLFERANLIKDSKTQTIKMPISNIEMLFVYMEYMEKFGLHGNIDLEDYIDTLKSK